MWLVLAFLSAASLGFYDVFKKMSLRENAVIPVLFLNTLFCALYLSAAYRRVGNGTDRSGQSGLYSHLWWLNIV